MSVIVTAKVPGDTDLFRKTLAERADDIIKISEQGRAAGCIHHQFAVGEGFILVVDEWESPSSSNSSSPARRSGRSSATWADRALPRSRSGKQSPPLTGSDRDSV